MVRATALSATALAVTLLSAQGDATDLLKNGAWPDGRNCVDQPWYSNYAVLYQCHGESNQQWEVTAEGMVRNAQNQCFELPETGDALLVVPCDTTRPQRWFVSDGQIKPQGFPLPTGGWSMRIGLCVDATQPDGKLILHGCQGGQNQKFTNPTFPKENEDIVLVKGPWPEGQNCLDYHTTANIVYVFSCHGQANQRWSFTAKDELRVAGDKCLEFDVQSGVSVRSCSGLAKQKWVVQNDGHIQPKGYQAADGSFVSMENKCLDASLDNRQLYLHDCIADQSNQKFISDVLKPKTQDLLKVEGTWAEGLNCVDYNYDKGYANIYSCHGRANQMWELTSDNQLRSMINDMCLTFEENEVGVYVSACAASSGLQKWRVANGGELHPLGFRKTSTGEWHTGATKCLTAALDTSVLFLYDCYALANQRFHSRAIAAIRDYVYVVGGATDSTCLMADDAHVVAVMCVALRSQVWEFTLSNELRVDGKCLAPNGSDVKTATCDGSASQKWKFTATGAIVPRQAADKCLDWGTAKPALALAPCNATSATQTFKSNVFQSVSGNTAGLFEKTSSLLDVVLADSVLSERVLTAAAAVVDEADKSLAGSVVADATAAKAYLLQFLFGTTALADYGVPTKVLYQTAQAKEFLLVASVLVSAAASKGKTLEAIKPFVTVFSDQLYEARREVLWDRVLTENAFYLEASVDGTLDDFGELGGALVAVCRAVPLDLSMCALAQYFQLMDQFVTFKYRLSVEGASSLRNTTLAMGAKVVKLYSGSPLLKSDPLWTRLMTLLMFQAPYVDVLPDAVLARASSPSLYLPALVLYSFFGAKDATVAPLESQVRFLSDQVTTHHFNNLLKMAEIHDMDALDAYMTTWLAQLPLVRPINNYTTSDFPVLAQFVAPLLCDDLTRAPLSLCQLETFNDGLQSVLRFERQRRADVVTLDDVLEVDVRKKLDVIDQEKKQYEIISTLQTVANKIGTTIQTEMTTLKKQMADSTAAIRKDIESTRLNLRNVIGTVGQQLQDSIDQGTTVLYNQIGQQAAAIRQDIYDSSRQLEDRLDQTGRAILGAIEDSKQELKYQIGAEAEKTRGFIASKTEELKTHMSNEAGGLRQFIDQKSNQIIGVVREEGHSTRVFMDQKTNQIIGVVQDESEKTRQVVRDESKAIQKHIDVKSGEIIGVVRDEGRATREVVVEKAAELKNHITYEANGVKDTVTAAKNDITRTMTKQYNSLWDLGEQTQTQITTSAKDIKSSMRDSAVVLADIHSGSCVLSATSTNDFTLARTRYLASLDELNTQRKTVLPDLKKLGTTTSKLLDILWVEKLFWSAVAVMEVGVNYIYRPKKLAGLSNKLATGSKWTKDDKAKVAGGLLDGVDDLRTSIAEAIYVGAAKGRVKAAGELMKSTAEQMLKVAAELSGKEATDPTTWISFAQVVAGDADVNNVEAFIEQYNGFLSTYRQTEISDLMHNVAQVIRTTCDSLDTIKESGSPFTSKDGAAALTKCYDLTNSAGGLGDRFTDALGYLNQMRSSLGLMATKTMECNKAQAAKKWAKGSGRRLMPRELESGRVDAPNNEPYYTMTYTALAKIILDYQLQEAAFQFCKFYEFRNGGVAPPMCDNSATRSYYTLAQVLAMRSWNPPTYNSVSVRAFLPTKPVFSDVYNRSYPYVDLARLRSGDAIYFSLPTWDLDWLKKYGWLSPTVAVEKVPSVYLESIVVYLPLQTNMAVGDPSASSITVAVRVQTTTTQFLSLTNRERVFQLSPQTFTSGATYGAVSCLESNYVVNPYDVSAQCVQDDATSDVCLREKGTTEVQNQKQLLPSLFTTWRLTADFSQAAGGALDVLVPQTRVNTTFTNGTTPRETVGDLMLIADLTVVQISNSQSIAGESTKELMTSKAPTAAGACCAANEFRVARNKCAKCSPGTTGALHGYACVPL